MIYVSGDQRKGNVWGTRRHRRGARFDVTQLARPSGFATPTSVVRMELT